MGIVNASPNSFHGACQNFDDAFSLAEQHITQGADIIDIGGEATNPAVNLDTDGPNVQGELDRIIPLVEAIKKRFDVAISIDTSRPQVMGEAIAAGATMINDQRALALPGAKDIILQYQVDVVLMHFILPPREPGSTTPAQLLEQIKQDLFSKADELVEQGLAKEKIYLDPGFGQGNYGKNVEENFYLLKHLSELTKRFSVLAGWSRKSMLGNITGKPIAERLPASLAAAALCILQGASIIRVHDVAATKDVRTVMEYFL